MTDEPPPSRPARAATILAFALVYLTWGTTYLAIHEGVKAVPPALFAGTRLLAAGLVLLAFLRLRGEAVALPRNELAWAAVAGVFLFVLGNGLATAGLMFVDSGPGAVLVATTPMWAALLERCWPAGERLAWHGWLGLVLGLGGVAVLLAPKIHAPADLLAQPGPWLMLASAATWALGAFLLRYRRSAAPPLVATGWQLALGGVELILAGLLLGELTAFDPERVTLRTGLAFLHLLIFGSLVGFVAYTWLLRHVGVTQAGTYAYVNPVVALVVGWLVAGEPIQATTVGGMVVVLAGVALVRTGQLPPAAAPVAAPDVVAAAEPTRPCPTRLSLTDR